MIFGVDSRIAYTALIALVTMQRLCELKISNRNERYLRSLGGREVGAGHYPWMVTLHAAFLVSCVAEVWLLNRPWWPPVALVSMLILIGALGLRWWALRTLGDRWTTRVVVVPGETLVTSGPYRWFPHPNYLAVTLEIGAIPMVHCAWLTAVVFSIANLAILKTRIGVEERALELYTLRRSS
jgi:methyltransferase